MQYANVPGTRSQVLAAAEERERKLLGAEEGMARRRRDMEREHGARMAEAEAAVRRLQVECEHQLEMERDRWVGVCAWMHVCMCVNMCVKECMRVHAKITHMPGMAAKRQDTHTACH